MGCSSGAGGIDDFGGSDVFLFLDIIIGLMFGSCKDLCGRSLEEGDCGCDFHCLIWGDCCPDFGLYCGDLTLLL